VVQQLIKRGASVDQPMGEKASTALHVACGARREAAARELITARASVDLVDAKGWSGLHLAAQNGSDQIVSVLLQAHASADLARPDGRTALMDACVSGNERCAPRCAPGPEPSPLVLLE
jgi:ankyrin repeat protein